MRLFIFFLATVSGLTEDEQKQCLEDASLLYLFDEGYCGYYTRVETCSLDDASESAIVISMECDESLIFGLSRLGVSVFFTTLSIFIILTIHWKFEQPIGNKYYKIARIISVVFLVVNVICSFVAMRKTPIHERKASGVTSVVFNALNILPVGLMYFIRASGNI
ncbi:unnamed protein product [Oikopleura dioica]|uniref:G-protein coupled receptors family 3 profile domain-containing protein n=1 Tax=Oikopleura dioica TaxID=34765 RepID=E4YUA9_OIKDI|nr:unnamed protein product [Oikopleura dioica]